MCLVSALTLSSIPKGTGNTINFNGAVNISIQEATWDVQVHHSISLKGKTCGSLDAEPVSSSSSSSSSSGSNPGNSNAVWSEDFNGMATNFSGKGSKVNQFRISLPPANEYTLNYKLYFEKNWTFYQGGKFHGFVPDKTVTGFRATEPDGWSGRITISGKKPTLYLYDQKKGGGIKCCVSSNHHHAYWNSAMPGAQIKTPPKRGFVVVLLLAGSFSLVIKA